MNLVQIGLFFDSVEMAFASLAHIEKPLVNQLGLLLT
jgi:hypothetical protein